MKLICFSVYIVFMVSCERFFVRSGSDHNNKEKPGNHIVNTCDYMQKGRIFCDDFESDEPLSQRYFEYNDNEGEFIAVEGEGRGGGKAMRVLFQKGEVTAGDLKKSFGRTPGSYIGNHAVKPSQNFDEIYWSLDVRLQKGWTGGGGEKLTRATVFVNSDWAQGLIAHLWREEVTAVIIIWCWIRLPV